MNELTDLVEAIYSSVEAEQSLAGVVEQIANNFHTDKAHLMVISSSEGLLQSATCGQDPAVYLEYERFWRDSDPRFNAANRQPGRLLVEHELPGDDYFEKSAFYNEYLSRVQVRHSLFVNNPLDNERMLAFAVLRSKQKGIYQQDEVESVRRLLPHLSRALRMGYAAQLTKAELRGALDSLPMPIAVLAQNGLVLYANSALEELLAENDGVYSERGVLRAHHPRAEFELERALGEIGRARMAVELVGRQLVVLPRAQRPPLAVDILPLRAEGARGLGVSGRARLLAVFYDPANSQRLSPRAIAERFGLTPVEAELAVALANGYSVMEFSVRRNISESTTRTHMKRLMGKMQVHRQADVVRLVLTQFIPNRY